MLIYQYLQQIQYTADTSNVTDLNVFSLLKCRISQRHFNTSNERITRICCRRQAACTSIVSFNSTIPRAHSFITSYFGFSFTNGSK